MGRSVENPKKHIVSCRISDLEMEALQQVAENNGISISEFLRQSLFQKGAEENIGSMQAA